MCPNVNDRSHVPTVDAATLSWPTTPLVAPACPRFTSSMQSPPASSVDTTLRNLRPGRYPRETLASTSRSRPRRPISVPVSISPASDTKRSSSKVTRILSRTCEDAGILKVPPLRQSGWRRNRHSDRYGGTFRAPATNRFGESRLRHPHPAPTEGLIYVTGPDRPEPGETSGLAEQSCLGCGELG